MITANEALDEMRKMVQRNRENGETDLRSILWMIDELKTAIASGKTLEEIPGYVAMQSKISAAGRAPPAPPVRPLRP